MFINELLNGLPVYYTQISVNVAKTYFQYCNEYSTTSIIVLVLKLCFYSPYKINYSLNSISLFHTVFKPNSKERYYTINVKQKNQNISWEIIPPTGNGFSKIPV